MKKLRVALVHDYLNQYGGGERVLEALMKIFPEAPIYTLLYDATKTGGRFEGRIGKTSLIDIPFVRNHHRLFIPCMPAAIGAMNLGRAYDLVVSDSAGYAKGIRYARGVFHLSYCHTPLRYAWETESYFKSRLFKLAFGPVFGVLKEWDRRAGLKPNTLIANSRFIAEKVKRYYGREVPVVYPPVDYRTFYFGNESHPGDHFLAVGRLLEYKNFDLIIRAFALLPHRLTIVGDGRMRRTLEAMAKPLGGRVTFLRSVPRDDQLRALYQNARALIFPQVEDFGLVAAEAQACGTPVIALKAGGAEEIVQEGVTGVFFNTPTPEALARAIEDFTVRRFDRSMVSKESQRFSFDAFREGIRAQLPPQLHSTVI